MAHPEYTAVSEVFCCAWCSSPVVLATEPGGDLVYTCTAVNCGHSVMVDCVEALALRADTDLVAAAWEIAGHVGEEPVSGAANGVTVTPATLGKRLAQARAKAQYHIAGGLDIRKAGDAFLVPSGTRSAVVHRVEAGQCSCEAGQHGRTCWHVEAVAALAAA